MEYWHYQQLAQKRLEDLEIWNPEKFKDIKEEFQNWDSKLKLKKIDDDDLLYVEHVEK